MNTIGSMFRKRIKIKNNQGKYYRILKKGDKLLPGDEFMVISSEGIFSYKTIPEKICARKIQSGDGKFRRRINPDGSDMIHVKTLDLYEEIRYGDEFWNEVSSQYSRVISAMIGTLAHHWGRTIIRRCSGDKIN